MAASGNYISDGSGPTNDIEKDAGDHPVFSASDADALTSGLEPEKVGHSKNQTLPGDLETTIDTPLAVLKRTISGKSASSWKDPGPPPDGGLRAWTQAVMGHLVIFCTWGQIASFGVFQTYYHTTLNRPPSDISWVGSVQIFLLFFLGTFSGRALDGGFFYPVFISGAILQVVGIFMTSLCKTYWQLFLAQGLTTGIANGLMFAPTMGLISTYFAKNRSLAMGIAATGSATGGLVFPALVRELLPTLGFGWTVRVIGFVILGVSSLTVALLRTRLPPRRTGPLIEWGAFKEVTYVMYCSGIFLCFWGLYFAFYYVGAFGRNIIGISYEDSISVLLLMNGIGIIGRLVPNYLADSNFGPLNTIIPFAFVSSLMIFCWAAVDSRGGLWAFSAVYGLFSAGIQSLFPATLSSLTTDLKKAGVRMGMGFSIVSFACLTGPPLAGALIQQDNGRYLYAQMWAGATILCGGLILVGARLAKTGLVFKTRI